jgi:hypothetical protein
LIIFYPIIFVPTHQFPNRISNLFFDMPNTCAIVKNIFFGLPFPIPNAKIMQTFHIHVETLPPHLLPFYWHQVLHGLCIDQHNKTLGTFKNPPSLTMLNTWRCFVNDHALDDFPTEIHCAHVGGNGVGWRASMNGN